MQFPLKQTNLFKNQTLITHMKKTEFSSITQYLNHITKPTSQETQITIHGLYQITILNSNNAILKRIFTSRKKTTILPITINPLLYTNEKFPPDQQTINIYNPTFLYDPKTNETILMNFKKATNDKRINMNTLLNNPNSNSIKNLENLIYLLRK